MKIKELHLKNFRNLVSTNLIFTENTSVISGMNGLGKSNALNGNCWFLTNTIFTDKWGSGENDVDSIIPRNATRGIVPEVSIITDAGTKFTKSYVSDWSKDGKKVKGHHTEYYINDAKCESELAFNYELFKVFGYTPKLKTRDVNELRLFIDPLYALQKLEPKSLRALLVDLGCSVTNEELYASGFEDLRPYGEKYLGKWDVMRKNLKEENKDLTKDIESVQAKLETVAYVQEYDEEIGHNLRNEYEDLVAKKAIIQQGGANPQIVEFEKKIEAIKASIQTKIAEHQNSINEKRKMLEEQKVLELEKASAKVRKDLEPLYAEREKLWHEIELMNSSIKSYEMTYNTQNELMTQYITMARNLTNKKSDLSVKLEAVRNSGYKGMITCPICFAEFPASEEEKVNFELHKKQEVESLSKEIAKIEQDKSAYKEDYEKAKLLRDEAMQTVEECKANLKVANDKVDEITRQCKILESQPIDTSAVQELDKRIAALDLTTDVTKEYQQVNELKAKVESLKNMDAIKIQDQVNELEMKIAEVNSKIADENVKRSKFMDKVEYEAHLGSTQGKLNDNEALLARCNRLIQTMISMINQKATEKTGLTFVMLEENLSNDGIKEVCYATVDGIPFKDVNTATKIKYGIKFIEKLKEILGHNDFPILADRMEGIDSFETIKNLTNEQLICTRVTDGKEITVC